MSRFPIYQQQTVAQSPTASGADFGAQAGQAMAQAGSVLTDIGVTMKRREDVIDRTIRARDFDQFAQESMRGLEPQDMARKETMDTYTQGLRTKMDELLGQHAGTFASRAEFKNQLLNQSAQYEKGAREAQVKAQHVVIGNVIEERTNQLAVDAGFAPDQMQSIFDELSATIDQFGDAMPPAVLEQYKNSGFSNIAATSIQQLMAQGQIEAAEAVLKDPNVNKYLNPDASRRFTISLGAEKGKRDTESRRQEANVQAWSSVTGIPVDQMTPQQMMIAGNSSTATMQMAEKLALTEMLQGAPATPQQRAAIMGMERQGRQTETQNLIANLPSFESGRMSFDEESGFKIQAEKLFPPQFRLDQASGNYVEIPGSGGIARLSQVLGRQIVMPGNEPTASPPVQGGRPAGAASSTIDNSFVDAQGRTDFMALPPQPGEPGFNVAEDEAAETIGDAPVTQSSGGMWNLADDVAGPIAGIQRGLGGGPIDIGVGQKQVAAAREVELQQRNLVRALQQNPRYAEGERKDIAVSISIEPSVMSNPSAYRTRLIEIGKYVQEEMAYHASVLSKPPNETTTDMRKQAMQAIPLFEKFYERMGLPPTVKTPDEALKMQPRPRQILTPDGRLFDVPQE